MDHTAGIKQIEHSQCLCVYGKLDFHSVKKVYYLGNALIDRIEKPMIQFKEVTEVASVALTLLLSWIRYAKLQKKSLIFKDLPEKLQVLTRVSGLEKTLEKWID